LNRPNQPIELMKRLGMPDGPSNPFGAQVGGGLYIFFFVEKRNKNHLSYLRPKNLLRRRSLKGKNSPH